MKFIRSSTILYLVLATTVLVAVVFPVLPNKHVYFEVNGFKHQAVSELNQGTLFVTTNVTSPTKVKVVFDNHPDVKPSGALHIFVLKIFRTDGSVMHVAENKSINWTQLPNGQYTSIYLSQPVVSDVFNMLLKVRVCDECTLLKGDYNFTRKTHWEFLSILDILASV